MTKLLQQAMETVRRLPADEQDEIARLVLRLAHVDKPLELIDPAHPSDVLEGLAHACRRDFAPDVEVEAAFRRFEH